MNKKLKTQKFELTENETKQKNVVTPTIIII